MTVRSYSNGKNRRMFAQNDSLSEIMCPQTLGDLTLPRPMIDRLQTMIETRAIMNMLFYGKVGTGKTSAARLFEDSADLYALCRSRMFVQWDGSSVKNADIIRKDITGSLSFMGFKICLLDRADLILKAGSRNYQASSTSGQMTPITLVFCSL